MSSATVLKNKGALSAHAKKDEKKRWTTAIVEAAL